MLLLFLLFICLSPRAYALCDEYINAFPCNELKFYEAESQGCKCCLKIGSTYECIACHKSYEDDKKPLYIVLPEKKTCVIPKYIEEKRYAVVNQKYAMFCNDYCRDCKYNTDSNTVECGACVDSPFIDNFKSYCVPFPSVHTVYDINNEDATLSKGFFQNTDAASAELNRCGNLLQNCLSCGSESSIGCRECVYSKFRLEDPNDDTFQDKQNAASLECSSDRLSDVLTLRYYLMADNGMLWACTNSLDLASGCNCLGSSSPDCGPDLRYFTDLYDIIMDLTKNRFIQKYSQVDVEVFLLKNIYNSIHMIKPSSADWRLKLFKRVKTKFTMRPLYPTDCTNLNINPDLCYLENERPTFQWNNQYLSIFVNYETVIKNIIFNGVNLLAEASCVPSHVTNDCCINLNGEFLERCQVNIGAGSTVWDSGDESENKVPPGLFNFEYWPDVKWTSPPSLLIENCDFLYFIGINTAYSMFSMSERAGFLTISNSVFKRNHFYFGLISNVIFYKGVYVPNIDGGYTCKDASQTLFSGHCQKLTIQNSEFLEFNFNKVVRKQEQHLLLPVEGTIILLDKFEGPITIMKSNFKNSHTALNLPYVKNFPVLDVTLIQAKCVQAGLKIEEIEKVTFDSNTDFLENQDYVDIGASSKYKIRIDKHIRIMKEDEGLYSFSKTGALIYLKNLHYGLSVFQNEFSTNAFYTGVIYVDSFERTSGSLFIPGEENKKFFFLKVYPISVVENKFISNFAFLFGLSIVITKNNYDLIDMDCFGILVQNNIFSKNVGCQTTFGNVIILCENIDPAVNSCDKSFFDYECWKNFYESYAPLIGPNGEKIKSDNPEGYMHMRWKYGFDYINTLITSSTMLYDSVAAKTFSSFSVTFSGNTCSENLALISNCLYVQGAFRTIVSDNIITKNSIPIIDTDDNIAIYLTSYIASGYSYIYDKYVKLSVEDTFYKDFMMESSPIILRFNSKITIANTVFDDNRPDFTGDAYFGGAITIDMHLGMHPITISGCSFTNYKGLKQTQYNSMAFPMITFSFFYDGLMVFDFIESLHELSGKPYNEIPELNITNCNFENNEFQMSGMVLNEGFNYTRTTNKYGYVTDKKYINLNKGFPKIQRETFILKYYDSFEAENDEIDNFSPMTSKSSFVKTNFVKVNFIKCTFKKNQNPGNRCLISTLFFIFTMTDCLFQENTNAEVTAEIYDSENEEYISLGMICVLDEFQDYWETKQLIKFENNQFLKNKGRIFYYLAGEKNTQGSIFVIKNVFNQNQVNSSALVEIVSSNYVHYIENSFTENQAKYGFIYIRGAAEHLYFSKNVIKLGMCQESLCGYITQQMGNLTFTDHVCDNNQIFPYIMGSDFSRPEFFGLNVTPPAAIIAFQSRVSFLKTSLTRNKAILKGFYMVESEITFQDSSLQDVNASDTKLPALAWITSGSVVNIINSTISNINCVDCPSGTVVAILTGTLNVFSSSFYSCTGSNNVIFFGNISKLYVEGSRFYNNTALKGEVLGRFKLGSVFLNSSIFEGNKVETNTLITASSVTFNILGCTFSKNLARDLSNAFYFKDSNVYLEKSNFYDNMEIKTLKASILYSLDSDIYIKSCTFLNGTGLAGFVYSSGDSNTIRITDSSFSNGFAMSNGGALYLNTNFEIRDCRFNNNSNNASLSGKGSHIYVETAKTGAIYSTLFSYFSGSAIFMSTINYCFMEGVKVDGASPYENQGIFCKMCQELRIYNSEFFNIETESVDGPAVYVSNLFDGLNISVTLKGSTFRDNYGYNGGAVSLVLGKNSLIEATIDSCLFIRNKAESKGGAIFYDTYNQKSRSIMRNTLFDTNEAKIAGGAVYLASQTINMSLGNTFTKNKAYYGPNLASYPIRIAQRKQVLKEDYSWFIKAVANQMLEEASSNPQRILEDKILNPLTNSSILPNIIDKITYKAVDIYQSLPQVALNSILVDIFKYLPKFKVDLKNTVTQNTYASMIPDLISKLHSLNISYQSIPKTQETEINGDLISGQIMDPPLIFDLIDEFGQVVGADNDSLLTLSSSNKNFKTNEAPLYFSINGTFILYPFNIIFPPGENLKLTLETNGIEVIPGRNFSNGFQPSTKLELGASVRKCINNEYLTDTSECIKCNPGQLNINPNEPGGECSNCPEGTTCLGGDLTGPSANFWRMSSDSDVFLECLNKEACYGSRANSEEEASRLFCKQFSDTDPLFCVTGFCSAKYMGNLCASCRAGFAKSNEVDCVSCSNNPSYYILSALIFILALAFIIFTIRNALKVKITVEQPVEDNQSLPATLLQRRPSNSKNKSSLTLTRKPSLKKTLDYNKSSILIKILLNYFQLVGIVANFKFRWPASVKQTLKVQERISASLSDVISIDCLLKQDSDNVVEESNRDESAPSTFFMKMALISSSPFLIFVISLIVWIIIFLIKYGRHFWSSRKVQFKANMTTTVIILLFMLHTTIVRISLLAFRCENLNTSASAEYFMERDLSVPCWRGLHLRWVLGLGIPSLLLWGFGTPLFAYSIIKKNKERLQDPVFKKAFGFLYDGYNKKRYYWEFIILYRKICMIFVAVFLVSAGIEIQAITVLGVAFLSYLIHQKSRPFIDSELNYLEKRGLVSAYITLYFGLYYISGDISDSISVLIFLVILFSNLYFLFGWIRVFSKEKITAIRRAIKRRKSEREKKKQLNV